MAAFYDPLPSIHSTYVNRIQNSLIIFTIAQCDALTRVKKPNPTLADYIWNWVTKNTLPRNNLLCRLNPVEVCNPPENKKLNLITWLQPSERLWENQLVFTKSPVSAWHTVAHLKPHLHWQQHANKTFLLWTLSRWLCIKRSIQQHYSRPPIIILFQIYLPGKLNLENDSQSSPIAPKDFLAL